MKDRICRHFDFAAVIRNGILTQGSRSRRFSVGQKLQYDIWVSQNCNIDLLHPTWGNFLTVSCRITWFCNLIVKALSPSQRARASYLMIIRIRARTGDRWLIEFYLPHVRFASVLDRSCENALSPLSFSPERVFGLNIISATHRGGRSNVRVRTLPVTTTVNYMMENEWSRGDRLAKLATVKTKWARRCLRNAPIVDFFRPVNIKLRIFCRNLMKGNILYLR